MTGMEAENKKLKIVVVGGGISGLACAYYLQSLTKDSAVVPEIIVLERGLQAGGVISTGIYGGAVIEHGPDSLLTQKPWALDLCRELGLEEHIIETNKEKRRTYVAADDVLKPLPDGFVMLAPSKFWPFFKSSLFSPFCKLRVASEVFIPKKEDNEDESVADFICRRFGREILESVVQPMVGGIYTGDLTKLSARATIPRFVELEQKYGSIIAGLSRQASSTAAAGARYSLFVSLDQGLSLLVESIIKHLPAGAVRFGAPVKSAAYDKQQNNWQLKLATDEIVVADRVIFSCPAYETARILNEFDPQLAAQLDKIPYASSAVVSLVYKDSDIPGGLDGFGFVVPIKDKRSILACSFASEKFANRKPSGMTVLRVFVGGVLQEDVYALPDGKILKHVCTDLDLYLDIKVSPVSYFLRRYPRSMPQYNVGHEALVESIFDSVGKHNNIALCGNAYNGVGIPDCIRSGYLAAAVVTRNVADSNLSLCNYIYPT